MLKVNIDFNKLQRKLANIREEVLTYILDEAEKQLNKYIVELKEFIEAQKGNWVPLKEEYQKQKERLGLDPRILIATGKYLDSFKVIREGNTFKLTAEGHEELAEYLEFGTFYCPPRPHWTVIDMKIRYQLGSILAQLAKYRFSKSK